jgi:hypothetical protein
MKNQLDEFKKHPILIVAALLLLSAFGYVIYGNVVLTPKLRRTGWYTVGTVTGTHKPPKGGTVILVSFKVSGEKYTASPPYIKRTTKGSQYLVKFLPTFPEKHTVLFDCEVPENLLEVPSDGWETAPFECEQDH